MSHAHLQSVFIIGAIVRRQQEFLGVHRYPTLLLPVTWVRKCLDYLMQTIYLEECCKAILGVPSLVISGNLHSLMIFVILQFIVVIAAPCFGRETQCFAIPGGAHLQSMFNPVPLSLWACCLLSCLSVDSFLFFFLSTTVKSASSFCTSVADCGLSVLPLNTLANVGMKDGVVVERGGVELDPVEGSGTALWNSGRVEGWVGSAGVGGAGVWGGVV